MKDKIIIELYDCDRWDVLAICSAVLAVLVYF